METELIVKKASFPQLLYAYTVIAERRRAAERLRTPLGRRRPQNP